MSSLLLMFFVFNTTCLDPADSRSMARAVTNGRLHTFLQRNMDLPLGLYERFDLRNTPALAKIASSVPPMVAVQPDAKGIRGIGLLIDGAYYSRGCVKGKLVRSVNFIALSRMFRKAQIAPTPLLRRSYTAYALFFLGIWLADSSSMDGPGTRLEKFLLALAPPKPHLLKAHIWIERKGGLRTAFNFGKMSKFPFGTTKIILLGVGGYQSLVFPWPMKKSLKYPEFLQKMYNR
ncbi:hypothetical protein KKF84_14630 [Myxococcota bacterium]|nr:hypothetical protein [Myxococcota bacterium]